MFYITKKTSATGKKLAEIEKKMNAIMRYQKKLAKEYGFYQWRQRSFVAFGGFSCVKFKKMPNKKIWKKAYDGYMPKMTGEGSKIEEIFSKCPVVSKTTLNEAVGFKSSLFQSIGLSMSNKEYYGIKVGEDWEFIPPKDCKEVTATKYKMIFTEKINKH